MEYFLISIFRNT